MNRSRRVERSAVRPSIRLQKSTTTF